MGEKKEYIERGALIRFAMDYIPNIHGDTTMKVVKRALEAAPAADDVVEVVRCEKCLHWQRNNIGGGNSYMCEYDNGKVLRNPRHFCAYGERREQT